MHSDVRYYTAVLTSVLKKTIPILHATDTIFTGKLQQVHQRVDVLFGELDFREIPKILYCISLYCLQLFTHRNTSFSLSSLKLRNIKLMIYKTDVLECDLLQMCR
jgi:K+ transporter